jgi:hypothetical protein
MTAAKETTLKELGEMLTLVVDRMATKDDIASLAGQLTSVERELKGIRRDLDDLREKVENVSGFRKEIDPSAPSKSIWAWTKRLRHRRRGSRTYTSKLSFRLGTQSS